MVPLIVFVAAVVGLFGLIYWLVKRSQDKDLRYRFPPDDID